MGQKQKTEKKKKKKKKEERLNNGDNNGQATHGARKYAWCTQAAWANYKIRIRTDVGTDRTDFLLFRNQSHIFKGTFVGKI